VELCLKGWRKSTLKQYSGHIRQWRKFCGERNLDDVRPNQATVVNFIAQVAKSSGYSVVDTARSAVSAVTITDGGTAGNL
jgi:hypothetical protein